MKQRSPESISEASEYLKAFTLDRRLQILYLLADGEKSVGELIDDLSVHQAAVSQNISRLRLEGLVEARREGRLIYYKICDERVRQVLNLLDKLFFQDQKSK
ncbi:metalloregulator ArsR/SmtB family transcription factor [uncultured Ruegeria sp.]|uniref:ArsR/SmtB family transcription factor n=1 Tax=uncultured Ruegeria sp. TaxID=259304 RepID=UPI002639C2F1|nr:metalloregulator ArsR/SmtB family transcription factor [uncultured Ruegeria sp.]